MSDYTLNANETISENTKLFYEEQLEAVKTFKELWDAGIITEEEFISKKKEILGM